MANSSLAITLPFPEPTRRWHRRSIRFTSSRMERSSRRGTVRAVVNPNVLLGLATHPTQRIIYGGLTGASRIAVFTYDSHGSVTFVTSVADQGAGPCWVTVSADGKYLYASNTGTEFDWRLFPRRPASSGSDPGIQARRSVCPSGRHEFANRQL